MVRPLVFERKEGTMYKVLNKHHGGVPPGAVHVGRGSKWGNPFWIGFDGDRAAVIAKHERWLADQHNLLRALDELRGHDLVCFCLCLWRRSNSSVLWRGACNSGRA
jgi:Domain of unknown function (DUF4326)